MMQQMGQNFYLKIWGKKFAINVKSLEIAGYDPRGAWGHGLSYAVANRGGCHLSAFVVVTEVFFNYINPYTTYGKHYWVYFFDNLYAAVNYLHTCLFTGFVCLLEKLIIKFIPKFLLSFFMRIAPRIAINFIDFSIFRDFFSRHKNEYERFFKSRRKNTYFRKIYEYKNGNQKRR